MIPRPSRRHVATQAVIKPIDRIGQALRPVVEALETRRLLAVLTTAQLDYDWTHLRPAASHDLAVLEYQNPDFTAALDADLNRLGLPLITPQDGTLMDPGPVALASARSARGRHHPARIHHMIGKPLRPHKPAHKPKHDPAALRDQTNPQVLSANFVYTSLPHEVQFTFNEDVSASLSVSTLTLSNLTDGGTVSPTTYSYNSSTNTATWGFYTTSPLATANWQAILPGSITDSSGNHLIGSNGVAGTAYAWNFYFIDGDFNGDGTASFADLVTLAQHYGSAGVYIQGDANYDGTINFLDLSQFSAIYTTTAPSEPMAVSAPQITANSVLLSWTEPNPAGVTGYTVLRNNTAIATNVAGTAYLDTGLTPGTSYTYRIQATGSYKSLLSLPFGVTTSAASTLPPGYTTANPAAPTNLQANAASGAADHAMTLTWTASPGSNLTYEIDRNGVDVGKTTGTTFTDQGLDASTTYTYNVIAYDPSYDKSAPATISASTGTDVTPPAAPIDLQATGVTSSSVSLSWVQPWDNVGVTNYAVTRELNAYPFTSTTTTIAATTYSDTSVSAGTPYIYSVSALDAQGNISGPAEVTLTTPVGTPTSTDSAPNQYIPPDWQNYFYNTPTNNLTAVLRQKMASVPGANFTPPPAAGWFDPSASIYGPGDVLLSGALRTSDVVYRDLNGNGILDPDEPAWIPQSNETGFQSTDTVIGGNPIQGMIATGNSVDFISPVGDSQFNSSTDVLVPDVYLIHGSPATNYFYWDKNGTGYWQSGDPVWTGPSQTYSSADTPVNLPNTANAPIGTWGKSNGITTATVTDPYSGKTATVTWIDQTTFGQDFANFYRGLDQLIPYFGSGASYPNDAWSIGSLLQSIGAPVTSGLSGTISIDAAAPGSTFGSVTVTGTGTHFTTDLVPGTIYGNGYSRYSVGGDSIEINGNWYPIDWTQPVTDTQLTLAVQYFGPADSESLKVINWTSIPGGNPTYTDPGTGLTFKYARGEPSATSLVFTQQFTQLQTALNSLTTFVPRYNQWTFDSSTSSTFISVANQVIAASYGVFGVANTKAMDPLWLDVNSGDADPGSVFSSTLLNDLRSAIGNLEAKIYVRNASGPNGWDEPDGGNAALTFSSDEPKMQSLLPAESSVTSTRLPADWSDGPNYQAVGPGTPIDPVELTETNTVIQAIISNGLWIFNPAYIRNNKILSYSGATFNGAFTNLNSDWEDPTSWPAFSQAQLNSWMGTQSNGWQGQIGYPNDMGDIAYDGFNTPSDVPPNTNYSDDNAYAPSFSVSLVVPAGTNPLGGSNMVQLSPDPTTNDVGASSWTWNSTPTVANYTSDQIMSYLEQGYSWAAATVPNLSLSDPGPSFYYQPTGSEPLGAHLFWELGSTAFSAGYDTTYSKTDFNYTEDIGFTMTPPAALFGEVPNGSYSYSPSHSAPAQPTAATPPTTVLPLTTQMDYQNVVPDSNLDGIVQVPVDLQSFGNDTGIISFQPQDDMAQSYVPIFTNAAGALPVNGYFVQGDFGTSDSAIGSLRDDDLTLPDANQNGEPYAYSLETHTRVNLYVNDANNHVKRIEVIRPGGNAAVFNFAWIGAAGEFSPIGVPMGWNNRDLARLYVLRDTSPNPDTGQSTTLDPYALEFPSGIVQYFNGGAFFSPNGTLATVGDVNGLSAGVPPASSLSYNSSQLADVDLYDSSRYTVTLSSTGGQITSAAYQSKATSSQTITTAVGYDSTGYTINALTKSTGGATIAPFSYSLSGNTITSNGVAVTRTGTLAGGDVTIKTTLPSDPSLAAGSYTSNEYLINSNGLITSDTYTLAEGGSNPTTSAATAWTYATGTGRLSGNGLAPWGQVTQISYPDGSWEAFTYDPTTGWMTEDVTPFQSSQWTSGAEGSSVARYFDYNAADSGNGQAADPASLVERPRMITTKTLGAVTGIVFNKYGGFYDPNANPANSPVEGANAIVTRVAPTPSATWSSAVFQTTNQINGYDSYASSGPAGNLAYSDTSAGSSAAASWLGTTVSQSSTTLDGFQNPTAATNAAVAAPYTADGSTAQDAFGRSMADTLSGGLGTAAIYTNSGNSWFGPSSVTETDESITKYTYSPTGQVATKIIYADSNHSVKTSFVYDAAGNVVAQTTTPVDASGNPLTGSGAPSPLTNTFAYDALNRLTREVDNAGGSDQTANRTTSYAYSVNASQEIVEDIQYPGGATEEIVTNLDGSEVSDTGNPNASASTAAVTPSTDSQGVVSSNTTDANGNVETAGSTWTSVTTNGADNTTTTYTNMLGEQYLVQQSAPNPNNLNPPPYTDAVTNFDGNGRAIKSTALDGTVTLTIYDPNNGAAGASITDINQDGIYEAGTDRKTIETLSPMSTTAGAPATDEVKSLSSSGNEDAKTTVTLNNTTGNGIFAGTDVQQTTDGLLTDTFTSPPTAAGAWSTIVTNPDQTQTTDAYTDGLLALETNLGTSASGSPLVTQVSMNYNGLREETSQSDYTGTTNYTYFQDGTLATQQLPGHSQQSVSTVDGNTEDTTAQTRADGTSVGTPENDLGLASSQSGAGVLPEGFTYDPQTGNLNTLTTYQSNVLGSGTGATTTWNFDPATGLLLNKQYADYNGGSNLDEVQYAYNGKLQMTGLTEPGVTTNGAFQYNAAGELASWSLQDSVTGAVSSSLTPDEMGRPAVAADTDNGRTFTETSTWNAQNQLSNVSFTSAGGTSVGYQYYPTTSTAANASPGALAIMTLNTPGGQQAATNYNYGSSDKRLQTISVNGVAIQYTYLANSNQIYQVSAGPADANGNLPAANANIVTTYTPDTSDPARVGSIQTKDNLGQDTIYYAGYTYSQLDQIATARIIADGLGNTISHNYVYTYDSAHGDALTKVTDTNNNVVASYSYDGAGNIIGNGLGTPNIVNQYTAGSVQYNSRGDLTNDGREVYGWDANDRLISETPDNPAAAGAVQEQMGYDSAGRLLWQDVSTWNSTSGIWVFSYSRHYVWDGTNITAVEDQNNTLLENFTWGPTGLIAITDYPADPNNPAPGTGIRTYLVTEDASGNVVALSDPVNGGTVASFQYDPFGNPTTIGGWTQICPFGFQQMLRDPSGNWYDQQRWYSPTQARFMSRDQSGNSDDNPYDFESGDPINNRDPDGRAATSDQDMQEALGLAFLQEKYGQQWTFTATPSGFTGVQAATGRQMVFDAELNQTGYFSVDRQWSIHQLDDGSVVRVWDNLSNGTHGVDTLVESTLIRHARQDPFVADYLDQAANDAQRLAQTLALGQKIGDVLDVTVRIGSGPAGFVMIDVPEAITGNSMTRPGETVSAGTRITTGMMVGVVAVAQGRRLLTIIQNARNGNSFERAVIRELPGAVKNWGRVYATIKYKGISFIAGAVPDVMLTEKALIEIKNAPIKGVSLTPQLLTELTYARKKGLAYRLIVSPGTHVTQPVIDAVAQISGRIQVYNRRTRTFSNYVP